MLDNGECREVSLAGEILGRIADMGDAELSRMIQAVIHRYNALHSDAEAVVLVLPRNDPEMRRKVIERAAEMAEKYTDSE